MSIANISRDISVLGTGDLEKLQEVLHKYTYAGKFSKEYDKYLCPLPDSWVDDQVEVMYDMANTQMFLVNDNGDFLFPSAWGMLKRYELPDSEVEGTVPELLKHLHGLICEGGVRDYSRLSFSDLDYMHCVLYRDNSVIATDYTMFHEMRVKKEQMSVLSAYIWHILVDLKEKGWDVGGFGGSGSGKFLEVLEEAVLEDEVQGEENVVWFDLLNTLVGGECMDALDDVYYDRLKKIVVDIVSELKGSSFKTSIKGTQK